MNKTYKFYSSMIEEGYNSLLEKDENDSVGKLYLHSLHNCNHGYFINQALESIDDNDIEIINGYNREDRFDHIVVKLSKSLPEETGIITVDKYGKVSYKEIEPNIYRFAYIA